MASTSTTIVSKKKLAVKAAKEDTLQSPVAAANTEPPVYVPTKLQSEKEADKAAARRKLREGAPHLFPHSEHDDRLDAVLVGASLSTGAPASSALAVADVNSKSVQVMEQREDIQPAATKRQQGILLPPVILHAKLPPKPDEAFFHRNVPSASPPSTYVPLIATYPPPLDNSRNTVSDVSASANYQQHYHPKVAFTPSKASPASPNNQGAPSHQHGIALPPVLSRTSPASTPFSSPVKIGSPNALVALSPSTVLKEIRRSASLPREAAELQAQPTDAILQPEAVVVKSATAHSSPLAAPVAEVKQETTAIKPVDPNYTPFPLNKIQVHRSVTAEQQRLNTAGTKERNIVEAKYPHFHGTSPSSKPGTPAGKIRPHSLVGQRQTEDNIAATPIVGKIPEPYVRPRSAAEQAIVEAELLAIRNDNVTKLNSAKIELDKAKLELEESERQDSEAAARRVKQQVAQGEQDRLKASEKRLALADTLRGIELDMENTVDGERGARKALQIEESNHRDVKLGREYEQMLTEVEALRPLQRLRQKHLEEARLQSGWLLDEIQVRSNQLLIEYRIWYLLNIDLSISYLVTIRQSEKHARGQLQVGVSNSLRRIQNAQQMRDQLETLKEKTMAEEAERKRIEKERLDDTTISQQVGSTLADIRRRREQEELAIKRAADAVELLKCERREETARRQQLEYESFCFAIDVVKPIGIIQTEFEERRDFIKNTYEKQFLREWYVDFMLPATAIMHAEERIRTQIVSEMAHNFAQMVTCPASMQAALFAVESNALIAKFGMKQWQEINNSDYIAQLRGKQLTESTANARDTFLSNTNLADKATATVAQSDPAAAGMKAHSYDHFNTVSLHPARYALSQKSQSTAVKSSDNQIVAAPSSPIRAAAVPNSKSISEQEAEERNAIESFHHRMLQEMDLAALKEQQRQQLPSGQREAMRRRNLERLGHTVE
eukprot:GILK01016034.1.p1 GENE.GILK01016034.1~~GILK01016034.1.p1  ORF type:complete len:1016 (-),score=120.03 GILK01016034.1:90-2945(-)